MRIKQYGDLGVGIFFLLLSLVYFIAASKIPESAVMSVGPQALPKFYALLTGGLSIGLIGLGLRRAKHFDPAQQEVEEQPELVRVLLTIASFTTYVMLLKSIGFLIMTCAYLFAQMMILAPAEKRRPVLFAVISVLAAVIIYFLFRNGFAILLPRGILG